LESEGKKQFAINVAQGERERVVLESEAQMQQQKNKAEGEANAIRAVAEATADSIRLVADSIQSKGGMQAVQLKVAENYIEQFGKLAKTTNTMILPSNLADVSSIIATAMNVIKQENTKQENTK
jgi:regulator of protease activity HflC (stomatin/prohibitin superfamily)